MAMAGKSHHFHIGNTSKKFMVDFPASHVSFSGGLRPQIDIIYNYIYIYIYFFF